MKVPQHLGIVFQSEPDWTISDWTKLFDFLNSVKIAFFTCYTRNGWSLELKCNTLKTKFIDYSQSKPLLASIIKSVCEENTEISLDNRSTPINLLLLESDRIDGFPPLMLASAEIIKLNSRDDSVYGFIDGIKKGVKAYAQTVQRNGI